MILTNLSVVRDLCERHGLHPNKSLGQNFLINPTVCPRIAEAGADAAKVAVEVGTGLGVLTKELSLRHERVISFELDEKLRAVHEESLADCPNVEIIYADFLSADLHALLPPNTPLVFAANLPYYVTTPIIMKLLEGDTRFESITVMAQREAAERITSPPGTRTCGAISAAVAFYAECERLFAVGRGSFFPAPNVDSTVIKLAPRTKPFEVDSKVYFKLVKSVFSERRKQAAGLIARDFAVSREQAQSLLKNPKARAENLTIEELVFISNELCKLV
ncbi:MAG: 16S rRNA (adenine(1518)-N(6)/adenine(1519)-N(6))-dimethyltransferase RsmA [Oscillospiraceae bacterium]|jgi:16S rRNA (adenine1518-N6/adenine1519-N6)-dimethyltransferase|nr:16S rRNA (adenine(1518)-N(6)/adenine(1519)-N(6))-dimethyltransferase RsmA [Oscillospiraceae bacterium]